MQSYRAVFEVVDSRRQMPSTRNSIMLKICNSATIGTST